MSIINTIININTPCILYIISQINDTTNIQYTLYKCISHSMNTY